MNNSITTLERLVYFKLFQEYTFSCSQNSHVTYVYHDLFYFIKLFSVYNIEYTMAFNGNKLKCFRL